MSHVPAVMSISEEQSGLGFGDKPFEVGTAKGLLMEEKPNKASKSIIVAIREASRGALSKADNTIPKLSKFFGLGASLGPYATNRNG